MALFSRKPKTRAELVAEADRARTRGRVKQAVAGYRKALESDPSDPSVNVKLAPLLARLGDAAGGAACLRTAAKRHLEAGFTDRAVAVNLTATELFPLDASFRLEVARLNVARGRKQDAVGALLEGGAALARARRWEAAAALLRRGLDVEPWHVDTCLALAPALARSGRRDEARALVDGLDGRIRGPARRRLRWIAFRLWPGFGTFWRWLRAG